MVAARETGARGAGGLGGCSGAGRFRWPVNPTTIEPVRPTRVSTQYAMTIVRIRLASPHRTRTLRRAARLCPRGTSFPQPPGTDGVPNGFSKGIGVAELTNLEPKLGEVMGLAMAAQTALGATRARDDPRPRRRHPNVARDKVAVRLPREGRAEIVRPRQSTSSRCTTSSPLAIGFRCSGSTRQGCASRSSRG